MHSLWAVSNTHGCHAGGYGEAAAGGDGKPAGTMPAAEAEAGGFWPAGGETEPAAVCQTTAGWQQTCDFAFSCALPVCFSTSRTPQLPSVSIDALMLCVRTLTISMLCFPLASSPCVPLRHSCRGFEPTMLFSILSYCTVTGWPPTAECTARTCLLQPQQIAGMRTT